MMETQELKSKIKQWDKQTWTSFYTDKFMRVEKVIPFKDLVESMPYRFRWVIKKVQGMDGSALDLGCGNGVLAHLLHREGFSVSGIDVSEEAAITARQNVPEGNFQVAFADQAIPFPDNHFNVVTGLEILEHVQDMDKFLQEAYRVTKNGGKILVTTPVDHHYDCQEHINYFTFNTLAKQLEKLTDNFKICHIYKQQESEGRYLFGVEIEVKKDE